MKGMLKMAGKNTSEPASSFDQAERSHRNLTGTSADQTGGSRLDRAPASTGPFGENDLANETVSDSKNLSLIHISEPTRH